MIVETRHPAAVVHVPRGMRRPRIDLVACTTPVEIPAIAGSDMAPVPESQTHGEEWPVAEGGRSRLYRVAGTGPTLWGTLRDRGGAPVSPEEFASGLRLRDDELALDDIAPVTDHGSPLCAWGDPDGLHAVHPGSPTSRGTAIDLDSSKEIRLDGRARAADAIRDHIARNYRITGGRILVRHDFLARGYYGQRFEVATFEGHQAPRMWHPLEIVAGGADQGAAVDYANFQRAGAKAAEAGAIWARLTEGADAGFGAAVAANSLPAHLRRVMARCARRRAEWGERGEVEILAAQREALLPLEIEALTGTCGAGGWEEVEAVLRRVRAAGEVVLGLGMRIGGAQANHDSGDVTFAKGMVAAIDRVYLPAIPRPEPHADDVVALAGLGSPR